MLIFIFYIFSLAMEFLFRLIKVFLRILFIPMEILLWAFYFLVRSL